MTDTVTAHGTGALRTMVAGLPHIMWIAAPDGTTDYVNQPGTAYAGYPAQANFGWDLVAHADDAERVRLGWEHATRTRTAYSVDCRLRRYDGEYRWHALRAGPIRDGLGAVVRWIGTATDIDAAKQLEADLRWAERTSTDRLALLETLLSKAPVGFGLVDREFRRVIVNEALAAFNGSTVAEQLGQPTCDLVPPFWPQLEPIYRGVLERGEAVLDIEVSGPSVVDASQTRHWLNSYYPVSVGHEVIGIGIVAVEITERKRAEEAYRKLAAIVECSADAIFGITADGIVSSWNAAAEALFGYTREEIIGKSNSILVPTGLLPEQEAVRARINAGGPAERLETTRRRKDGSIVDVLITSAPVNDETNAVVGRSVTVQDITERLAAHRALLSSQRQLAEAQKIAQVGSFEVDLRTGVMVRSDEQYVILGLDPETESSADSFLSMVHPDDWATVAEAWTNAVERGIAFDLVYRIVRPDSELRWVHARAIAERDEDGAPIKLIGILRDNTDRIEAMRVQQAADTRLEVGFEQAGIGAGILDLTGIPIRVNAAVCELLGRPKELLEGRSWLEYNHPDDVALEGAVLARLGSGHDSYADERRYIRPDGSVVWAALHITLVRDEEGHAQYYLAQLQDICERKQMEADLIQQALHDSLTGLPNQALLNDRLVHGLAGTRRRGSHLGVIFLDLDHFKVVNDSVGRPLGDDLLRHAADLIAAVIRPGDTVARFGGDEFVIVCDDVTIHETEEIAERVLAAVGQPCQLGGQQMTVTASVGVVLADAQATPESLVHDSDAAMYLAKAHGRNRVEVFDEALRSKTERRTATESGLRHALERNQFTVHYQPIVDLSTGEMVSAEALLRWNHPERGIISPAEFIPLAEETGLIQPIGAWVLEQACEQLVRWQRSMPSMTVAVNLSVRQILAPGIDDLVRDVLIRSGARPESLCLELTESVFMEDADYFVRTLTGLKSLGVTLSIDDFGTGYSSLSYLKQFPVDAVKIDRAFVDELGNHAHNSALVAAIIAMADALNLGVTAEGIETRSQLELLKKLQCKRAQGFYLARPMPAAAMNELVTKGHCWVID
jgi:diguanylate cyclase (GGDEF)-like protein/PAS domain S-box-containing protein